MEAPIHLAIDSTENWEKSDTVLGESELFFEAAGEREDPVYGRVKIKHLLLGDGKPAGPGMERLRATPEIIHGLPETLFKLEKTDKLLRLAIEAREVYHDDSLKGTGVKGSPLRVNPGSFDGITSRAPFSPDGVTTAFPLPEDFLFTKLAIVQINGLIQEPDEDYSVSEDLGTITFISAPEALDRVTIFYTKKG